MQWGDPSQFVGKLRCKTCFLFFPKKIGFVWRWLEVASWREKLSLKEYGYAQSPIYAWVPVEWIDS